MENKEEIINKKEEIINEKEEISEKELISFKSMVRITLNNASNTRDRLKRRELASNIILIYYSVSLIIYSLTGKFFIEHFNIALSEYFNIILSIVLLVFSLININANYSARICRANESITKLHKLRKTEQESYHTNREVYFSTRHELERRSDGDFFKTLKKECRQKNTKWFLLRYYKNIPVVAEENDLEELKKIREFLCEINPIVEIFKYILETCLYILLTVIPVIVFLICFL